VFRSDIRAVVDQTFRAIQDHATGTESDDQGKRGRRHTNRTVPLTATDQADPQTRDASPLGEAVRSEIKSRIHDAIEALDDFPRAIVKLTLKGETLADIVRRYAMALHPTWDWSAIFPTEKYITTIAEEFKQLSVPISIGSEIIATEDIMEQEYKRIKRHMRKTYLDAIEAMKPRLKGI